MVAASHTQRDLILAAATNAAAAVAHLVEAARRDEIAAAAAIFDVEEVAEHLADALQVVLRIQLEDTELPADRREAIGQLLGSVARFLDGWA